MKVKIVVDTRARPRNFERDMKSHVGGWCVDYVNSLNKRFPGEDIDGRAQSKI